MKLQYIYFRDPLAHGGRESTRGGRETIPSRPPVPEGVAKLSVIYFNYKRHCTPHCTPHCTRIAPSLHLEPLVKRTKRKAGQEKKTAEVDGEKPRAGRESKARRHFFFWPRWGNMLLDVVLNFCPSTFVLVHTDLQTYKQTYIHTYIHIYLHTYIHTYIHKYIHTYRHTYLLTTTSSIGRSRPR